MRAAVIRRYGDPDVFEIADVDPPAIGPRDVLIEAHAASVNPVDAKMRRGYFRAVSGQRLPWILGLDVSGVVRQVGSKVTSFQPGDEVYASPTHRRPGCYAELVAVDARAVARKPKNLTHAEAASLPLVALTAWATLVDGAKLAAGQRVLIQAGSGGVGVIAIQLAKHLGAHVATTCSARNAELVRSLGADQVIDYTKEAYAGVLRDLDAVVESLGGEERARARSIVRRGGYLGCLEGGIPKYSKRFGWSVGPFIAVLDGAAFTIGSFLFRGVWVGHPIRPIDGAKLARITDLVEKGAIRPVVDRVVPLDRIAEAHAHSESGRARGKIVVAIR